MDTKKTRVTLKKIKSKEEILYTCPHNFKDQWQDILF